MPMQNQVLIEFEQHADLGPTYVARLLGMAYSSYAQIRSGDRPLQRYTKRHIEALRLLPPDTLHELIVNHAYEN